MDTRTMDFFNDLLDINRFMKNEWFDFLSSYARSGGVVFVGDSIMQEFCVHEMLSLPDGISIHNRGIGGDTTSGLLERVRNSILSLKPAVVFILIGTNDLNASDYNEEVSIANIRRIHAISADELPEAKLILIGILPTNPDVDAATVAVRTAVKIRRFNDLLHRLADECGCAYVDLHPVLSDAKGYLREDFTRDGLHLRPSGYAAMLEYLMPYMNFLGESR